MRAMSLHEPWASLIAHGLKRIETRGPRPTTLYRGPLLIHAAKKLNRPALLELRHRFESVTRIGLDLPVGAIVAVSRVVDIREMTPEWIAEQTPLERAVGDWQVGRYGWVLEDVRRLDPPIPLRGFQGLFNVERDHVGGCAWARLWAHVEAVAHGR